MLANWVTFIYMDWLGFALQLSGIALEICILVLMARRHLYRQFPVFASYITYVMLQTALRAAFLSNAHLYFYVYWCTAPVEVIFAILAVHESFLRVFHGFYLLRWFRVVFPGSIAIALLYSVVRGYFYPPVHASAVQAAIILTMLTGQYVILAISVVFFALVKLLGVPWRIHEYRIVLGFGISSVMTALAASVRSVFVTRFAFVSEMLPALTYILALAIWISAVVYPLPSEIEIICDQPLEEVVKQLRRDRSVVRSLLRRR